ncbi:sporulation protein YpjB [Metabacillus indicus]|uniref:sporulation protein YpjB n=1 Tax=Metabacillus indicus TaxID=246786 RepID=UPI00316DBF93
MKKRIAAMAVFMIMALALPFYSLADHRAGHMDSSWDDLNKLTDTALQLTKQNRFEESLQLINYFGREFEKSIKGNNDVSAAEIRTISASQQTAVDKLQETAASPDQKVRALIRLRLVVDAAASEHQPLWSSMEAPVMSAFTQVKDGVKDGNNQAFEQNWEEFVSLYETVYPSMLMDLDSEQLKRIEAHKSVVEDSFFAEIPVESQVNQLTLMEEDLQNLFERVKEDEADPSLWWVMISTGSIIFMALSYTGWRKYKGEKDKMNRERDFNK